MLPLLTNDHLKNIAVLILISKSFSNLMLYQQSESPIRKRPRKATNRTSESVQMWDAGGQSSSLNDAPSPCVINSIRHNDGDCSTEARGLNESSFAYKAQLQKSKYMEKDQLNLPVSVLKFVSTLI